MAATTRSPTSRSPCLTLGLTSALMAGQVRGWVRYSWCIMWQAWVCFGWALMAGQVREQQERAVGAGWPGGTGKEREGCSGPHAALLTRIAGISWPSCRLGIAKLKLHASDGVRSVYTLFARLPKVTSETAPALFTYLQEGEQEKGIAPASGAGAAVADAGATPGGGAGDGDAGQGPGSGAGGAGPSPAMDE